MNRIRYTVAVALVAVLLAVGCASVPRDAGFSDVEQRLETRLPYEVRWHRGTPEDTLVAEYVERLVTDTLTVDQAVQIALLNNRRLQAVYEDLGVAQAQLVQAGLLRNPIFSAGVRFPIEDGTTDLDLRASFAFLEVFYIPLRKAVAESAFEAAKLRVAGEVLELAARTRAAYYGVQAAHQRLEMFQQIAAALGAGHEAAWRLRAAGNVPMRDVQGEQALLEQARLAVAAAETRVVESRERLNRLLGLWGLHTNWSIPGRLPAPDGGVDLDDVERRAIEASLDLALARQDVETFGRRLGFTDATVLVPALELGASAKQEHAEWQVGPVVALPIPLFDQGQARVAAAQSELRRRQELYVALAVDVRSAARVAAQHMVAARRIAEHYRDVVLPLHASITTETQLQYNAMQIGIFHLLQAKQQEIEAGRGYVDALEAYWRARTRLEVLLQGKLTEPAIRSERVFNDDF